MEGRHASSVDQLDDSSDYGSDFTQDEEGLLDQLLSKLPAEPGSYPKLFVKDIEDDEGARGAAVPRVSEQERRNRPEGTSWPGPQASQAIAIEVELDGGSGNTTIVESAESRAQKQRSVSVEADPGQESDAPDTRSPLERFRTAPGKALSVTDLISPSWCELQYWYTLTKHGRKRRTPAMKQGSAVHKTLEDQVHQTVAVDIQSKEDAWGLRIWNVIEGLKTLRETGMTRELEIWGVVDGLVVNGIIDELSYICPDRELEEEVTARTAHGKTSQKIPPADQSSITKFLKANGGQDLKYGVIKSLRSLVKKTSKIYLTDVKTRGTKTIPKGPSFRPTLMQLMLYHRLLSDLATDKVDSDVLFDRHGLDASAPFSDEFIAQVGSLNEVFYDAPSDPANSQEAPVSSQDPVELLLGHNSLRQLWRLMMQEFQRTMPAGVNSIGNVLKAEYRDQADGSILGIKTFLYDADVMQTYLDDELSWWKGEREAQGVCIEEAYKCRICEFADECTWRKAKIDQATQAHRTRSKSVV
ncbi:MAG: hypothetical protein FRX48_01687 [Lasallia pustulata]|uniref:Exonuclease V n=1 Tax=Lasallia pustulata TaxID=136370 RepID=A0A5M8Q1U8_9LECA|nr:MAG: hypothetical protein FRX48_01687 [Lasallia pustulata]